ncbi:DNA repair protein rad5 [Fusarium flagelliforme]|uniref:DNA repair protein rad5 n=1 Tax=Fusarium flagelliforme TaxID=2675880 RepID=A0A395MGC6_9HYPO|nr:DNA repair protein rad5 [Fusarium flagelliforme]
MAAPDEHLVKRRRLENSTSFACSRGLTPEPHDGPLPDSESWDINPQSFLECTVIGINSTTPVDTPCLDKVAPQPSFQNSMLMDGACATSTSVIAEDIAETVCFGTLTSLTSLCATDASGRQSFPDRLPLNLGVKGTLQSLSLGTTYGTLEARDTKLLELFSRHGIEFELLGMSSQLQKGKEKKTTVWATLYGPRDLAPDLCDLFHDLELYLQDPTLALRDIPYFNPQRFINKPGIRTVDFQDIRSSSEQISSVRDENLVITDVLDKLSSEHTLPETPGSSYLLTELMSHQKQGLSFMIRRELGWRLNDHGQDVWSKSIDYVGRVIYTNNVDSSLHHTQPLIFRGGIIADAMGLGKTLSMISLIAHDKALGKEPKLNSSGDKLLGRGTLLVLPPSLLHNWEKELANTLAKEWRDQKQSPIFSHNWHRVVLDEAHEVKDASTSKARAVCALRSSCRWAVTGTPMQNRLSELFSLFSFLRLTPYHEKRSFNEAFTNPCVRGEERGPRMLVQLLGYIMLRRSKNVITLPQRTDYRRFLQLNLEEQYAYDTIKQKAIRCLEDTLASRMPQEGYSNVLQKINALRVICELGCRQPGLEEALSEPLSNDCFLSSGEPDEFSTPSTITDDVRHDDCGSEANASPFGDIFTRPQECLPLCTSSILPDPCPNNPQPESSLTKGQWPTKIQALIKDLQSCATGTKSVVFSYRTSILDFTTSALRGAGIGCVQIDGKSNAEKRSQIISDFSRQETIPVLLLSLGCGAVGPFKPVNTCLRRAEDCNMLTDDVQLMD